jgi:hypothetical protein
MTGASTILFIARRYTKKLRARFRWFRGSPFPASARSGERHPRRSFAASMFLWLMLTALFVAAIPASAHEGPPFPILVDKTAGCCVISVWADPDIGTATFLIFPEALPGKSVPEDLQIEVAFQPASGRLAEARVPALREELRGPRLQYTALVSFDQQELWNVRLILHSAQGVGEVSVQVEATPPGYGRWDMLIYLLPFLAVGFLWFRAFIRRTRLKPASKTQTHQD